MLDAGACYVRCPGWMANENRADSRQFTRVTPITTQHHSPAQLRFASTFESPRAPGMGASCNSGAQSDAYHAVCTSTTPIPENTNSRLLQPWQALLALYFMYFVWISNL
jgi:hypothetical protein